MTTTRNTGKVQGMDIEQVNKELQQAFGNYPRQLIMGLPPVSLDRLREALIRNRYWRSR